MKTNVAFSIYVVKGNRDVMISRLKKINLQLQHVLQQKFSIVSEFEIKGSIIENQDMLKIIRIIMYDFFPYRVKIEIILNRARENTENIFFKEFSKENYKDRKYSVKFCLLNSKYESIVNAYFVLICALLDQWTKKQWDAVMYYEKYGSYKKIAEKLKIAVSSSNERVLKSNWYAIKQAEEELKKILWGN